jgi:hypothetical protein
MANPKTRHEARLQALISAARDKNIEVRMEKLLREVGYRVHSGRCLINGREVILIDRDAPIGDQIDCLSSALAQSREFSSEYTATKSLIPRHSGQAGDS